VIDAATLTVYVTDSSAGVVDVYKPEPAGVPTVSAGSGSVKDVAATSASFSAELNPRSEPNEAATSYSFEYGPCDTPTTCKSSPYADNTPVPEGVLAPNYEPDVVSAHLQGLSAHTSYHMRVVAHNSHPGVVEGEEVTFTTQAAGGFVLPDGREWEMVSPANKYGALIQTLDRVSQASATGDAITYAANAPIEAQPPGSYASIVQALSARSEAGWHSLDIDAPHETAPGFIGAIEYPFFSEDLSVGILQPTGAFEPLLSTEASEQTAFQRTVFDNGDRTHFCATSCYTPLVSGAPGFENVPPGTVFGAEHAVGGECVTVQCGPQFAGSSADASHIVLESALAPLVGDAPLRSLYEWVGGQLSVVSVLPDKMLAADGTLGTTGIVRNAVSSDGSRVVWSDGSHLYLRDTGAKVTVQLDEVRGGTGSGEVGPVFETASSDGSRIFFSDSQRLTKDASGPSDLYECQIVVEGGELKCHVTDLTGGTGAPVGLTGLIQGVSEDGAYVYFAASGVLTGAQTNEHGETAIAGQPNLYVRHFGVTSVIAVLSSEDSTDWSGGGRGLGALTARVSGNGHWFAFMSERSLTGFDNRDAVSGKRAEEVFLYHAGDGGESSLVCASCNPTDGRPSGVLYSAVVNRDQLPGDGGGFIGRGIAGLLPGWTSPYHQPRYLSDSGRLFFDSFDALAPQDTNGAEDAYQFEPAGVGGCTASSTMFVVVSDGCVGLISSGASKDGSAFLDASESGGDVFFLTKAQLSPLDTDSVIDIYDAHECSAGGACIPPLEVPAPSCEGDACQSPVAEPEDPTPGSLTYRGPGNPSTAVSEAKPKSGMKSKPVKCNKVVAKQHGKFKRHSKCVRKRTKKAKRSNRRAGR
jgi:hypothetical protein